MRHKNRIQRKRTKGFRLPDGTVCVTRPGPWGNPFKAQTAIDAGYAESKSSARNYCVRAFEDWLIKGDLSEFWGQSDLEKWIFMRSNLHTLKGKKLACWCPLDRPCHADILAKYAEIASMQSTQIGYVIEIPGLFFQMCDGYVKGWIPDSNDATYFARMADAVAAYEHFRLGKLDEKITKHFLREG